MFNLILIGKGNQYYYYETTRSLITHQYVLCNDTDNSLCKTLKIF